MSDLPVQKDPLTTGIEKTIEESFEMAQHYLDQILDRGGMDNVGGLVSDTTAYWRFKNKINIVLKMKSFLESKGLQPKKLLPKTVWPLLESGSLENTDELRDRWAALLAHAAIEPESVPPSYVRIL